MKKPNYAKNDKCIGRGLEIFGLGAELKTELNKRQGNSESISLLEIGCGKGNLLVQLSQLYPTLRLFGVNKNRTHGIKNEQELKDIASIFFADAKKLPFSDAMFEIVISQVTFLHIENKARAIEEVYRILKPGGVAFISLGSYSIRRKRGYKMPEFYTSLRKKLGHDFNPRFLIKSGSKYVSLSQFFKQFNKDGIRLIQKSFVSESQKGIAHWLVIHKKNKELNLGLIYQSAESKKLTKLFSNKNPVNWGCIDVYQLD